MHTIALCLMHSTTRREKACLSQNTIKLYAQLLEVVFLVIFLSLILEKPKTSDCLYFVPGLRNAIGGRLDWSLAGWN